MKYSKAAAKPFIKWAGGKGQLLAQLDEHLPQHLSKYEFTYVEPFVGGGAMLFHMLQKFPNINKVIINDINPHLITAYKVIKDNPNELIEQLSQLEKDYIILDEEEKKSFYLDVRNIFNKEQLNEIERTKFLIFLNRTCFNGLYRVNSKGHFNVPFGKYSNPSICNSENILADSELLNGRDTIILQGDYEETIKYIDETQASFFYFDPPYRPLSTTSSFNSYAKETFDDKEQIRLSEFCKKLNSKLGVKWMLSNSDCSAKNPDDLFFEEIYADFQIHRVYASRSINANPSKRGKLTELLIRNYPQKTFASMVAENVVNYTKNQ